MFSDEMDLTLSSLIHVLLIMITVMIAFAPYLRRKMFIMRYTPPGPSGLPLLGNILQLQRDLWIPFTKWKHEYGDLVFLSVLGQPILVLNSLKTATDLLDRRADIYSDRPKSIVGNEMLCGGRFMALMNYNSLFKKLRRAIHSGLTKQASAKYHQFRKRDGISLVRSLLQDGENWRSNIEVSVVHILLSILYGRPASEEERHHAVTKVRWFSEVISYATGPGNYLVEFFTWMRYLPRFVAPWKDQTLKSSKEASTFFQGIYSNGWKDTHEEASQFENLSKSIHEEQPRYGIDDIDASWVVGMLYIAGSETTVSQLSWFIVAMAKYSNVQEKAQTELDTVVGRDRIPNIQDIDRLPYMQAVVKELFRWAPVTPIGVPHIAAQDDWYNGYFIPKGTMVLSNIWAIHRDQTLYGENIEEFNPTRFLDEDGKINIPQPLIDNARGDGHCGFGFGKRACPGRNVAEDNLQLSVAYILWSMKIEPKMDKNGDPIVTSPNYCYNSGVTIQPQSYQCSFLPRFPEVQVILENEANFL